MKKTVAIIGGGASGIIASIYAAKRGYNVIILERNSTCCKKILITGNGKCNYFNDDWNLKHYQTNSVEKIATVINNENKKEILSFFNKIGIVPKIKNGYYYPYSNQAVSIKTNLLREATLNGVVIKNDCFVEKVEKKDNHFLINVNEEIIVADAVIMATGSKACPKTGSDGNGYTLAESFGHTVVPVLPSLVPLKTKEKFLKEWSGIRTDVNISLYVDGVKLREEYGEIQLTDYGISGICVFNLSSLANINLAKERKVLVKINFIPWVDSINTFINFIDNQYNKNKKDIMSLLEGILNYKLVSVLLKEIGVNIDTTFNDLTSNDLEKIYKQLSQFELEIIGSQDYDKAQVCSGGVSLLEVDMNTMQSKLVDNLYFTGEILDVDGDCGGYNLAFAWVSGMIAGKEVLKDDISKTN